MRHSIKTQMTIFIICCTLLLLGIIVFLNNFFLEKFYVYDKQETFVETYYKVNDLYIQYENGEIEYSELKADLEQLVSVTNISMLVVGASWEEKFASDRNVEELKRRLQNSLFIPEFYGQEGGPNPENHVVVEENENYTIQRTYNPSMKDSFLEMYGYLSNGNILYMNLAVKSIQENVDISNRFVRYIGVIMIGISAVAAVALSSVITKPIKEISTIAEKMSELDFDAKYTGNNKSEIGILGKSMNTLSEKLEKTISELKSANLELKKDIESKEEMDEMRKDFLSNVSHELKTPIALIQGYAEGLKENITDDPESMEFYCDVIIDEAQKMNTMVKKLLSLNQLEFGNEQPVMERFNLTELIASVVHSNELIASQKGITIEFHGDKAVYVWCDEYKTEEVVTNYLTNAINHCDYEKKIVIDMVKTDGNVRVSVFNTGDIIPQEDIDNIWIKFYKVDKARTREYGGNGIGLSIVKAIQDSYNKGYGVINHSNGVEFWFELDADQ